MSEVDREVARWKARAETAEARLAVYNSGGFADADALAAAFIPLTAERDALAERVEKLERALRCLRIEQRGPVIELAAYMPDGSACLLTVSHATEAIAGIVLGKLRVLIDEALAAPTAPKEAT